MNEKPANVEENIILATIACIDRYGISGATNRQIAQLAGVNLAAINYYFRSKEHLIQRCMEITLKNAFDLGDFPPMQGAAAQERCIAMMMHLFEGGVKYPGLTRAHFYNLVAQGKPDPLLSESLNRFIDELAADVGNRQGAPAPDELKITLIQIVSSVLMTTLAPDLFEHNLRINLRDPTEFNTYVTRLVNRLLG